MFSKLKRLFTGSGSSSRVVSHPADLAKGDIIVFGYSDILELTENQFQISKVNTYMYGDMAYPELVLKDRSKNIIYMMVEDEDGEEYLAISKKIPKNMVNDIISKEDIQQIVKGEFSGDIKLKAKPIGMQPEWFEYEYKLVDRNVKGSFILGDARLLSDEEMKKQQRFNSYIFEDSTSEFALEVEVYETGEVELSVTIYADLEEIKEIWPAA